jgi:hypothetical protein
MKIVYYSSAVSGSGHIVTGIAIGNALKRKQRNAEYSILSSSSYAYLADFCAISHLEIPLEDSTDLKAERYQQSHLFTTLNSLDPDILIVDLSWFMLHSFIDQLPAKKIILFRRIADEAFSIDLSWGTIRFRPDKYDFVFKTEPFTSAVEMDQINPLIIKNREEIYSRADALRFMDLDSKHPICFFTVTGNPGEFEQIKKSYSYLEDEGYQMVYTTNIGDGIFPIVDYFNAADLLICGAGYNAFWEAVFFEKKAFFVPIRRRFEDTYQRVAECQDYRFEQNGADQLADLILQL